MSTEKGLAHRVRLAVPVLTAVFLTLALGAAHAQVQQTKGDWEDKFRQLDEVLPTPNTYRTAGGKPGHEYWQQQADYKIAVTLDDEAKRLSADQTITYTNNSPDALEFLWLHLDHNRFKKDSDYVKTLTYREEPGKISFYRLNQELQRPDFDGGMKITAVTDARGNDLDHVVVDTLMRIDLPEPLGPGRSVRFSISWETNIHDHDVFGGRSGYIEFDDGESIYYIAQWFPRMTAYTDYEGWTNKKFLGRGEFTLEFGDYELEITVPEDFIVSSTGALQNQREVLTTEQIARLGEAKVADKPVYIVTPEEATQNQAERASGTKTWKFKAENVRDVAFSASRKFIWDAQGFVQDVPRGSDVPREVMAMSFYPPEANHPADKPLWYTYSTEAIIHTMEVYNRYAFPYPYAKAQSVNWGEGGGMEYPEITFNGGLPVYDEKTDSWTYTRRTKYGLIGVIIHEIGHIYFPMVVNSDERQWTWMDEGINSFLQVLAQEEWEEGFPHWAGYPHLMVDYMKAGGQVPVMTQSDSVLKFGANAYAKVATALNILRETVMGRELFDHAFKTYSERWRFKRPTPADFFRTMEEASGVDLDWFFRGWFYTTDHVDISLDKVTLARVNSKDPEAEEAWKRAQKEKQPKNMTQILNEGMERRVDRNPDLKDFYNENDEFTVTNKQRNDYRKYLKGLEDWEKEVLESDKNLYLLEFSNKGGLVMPLILAIRYEDGSSEELRLPAEIWRLDPHKLTRLHVTDKIIASITVDPHWETADTDTYNNHWPRRAEESRLEAFKRDPRRNMMLEALQPLDDADTQEGAEESDAQPAEE